MMIKRIVKSFGIGIIIGSLLSVVFFLLSFFGIQFLFTYFIYSSLPLVFVIDNYMPASFVYWLFPDGGPAAAVGQTLFVAWFQLVILSAAVSYFIALRKYSSNLALSADR